MKSPQHAVLVASACTWIAAIGVGFTLLSRYSAEPGAPAIAPQQLPHESRVAAGDAQYRLVMMVHPHCPCSRASISELNNLMARLGVNNVKASVLVVKPAEFADEWADTESIRNARRIPGIDVVIDVDGVESARLGAQTSGQVLLYDPAGELQFAGGITPDRGHVGDSPGRQRIVSLIKHGTADAKESRVFGCSLGTTVCPLPPRQSGNKES